MASLALLAAVIVGTPRLFAMTKDIAWDRYLGELSYPLYICHFLFGWMLLPNTFAKVGLALLLSLLASMALYHFVDLPVDRWRQRRFARAPHMTLRSDGASLTAISPPAAKHRPFCAAREVETQPTTC